MSQAEEWSEGPKAGGKEEQIRLRTFCSGQRVVLRDSYFQMDRNKPGEKKHEQQDTRGSCKRRENGGDQRRLKVGSSGKDKRGEEDGHTRCNHKEVVNLFYQRIQLQELILDLYKYLQAKVH